FVGIFLEADAAFVADYAERADGARHEAEGELDLAAELDAAELARVDLLERVGEEVLALRVPDEAPLGREPLGARDVIPAREEAIDEARLRGLVGERVREEALELLLVAEAAMVPEAREPMHHGLPLLGVGLAPHDRRVFERDEVVVVGEVVVTARGRQ